ncbi:MAG: tripartite tricarboxylate transporter substrate binding protein [Betaproteobacteria bacterium]|nr:tripartite tricarboxylate transporter substrate binding protein [Betaproteobacteria bacterium]
MRIATPALLLCALIASAPGVLAQTFPTKPIRIIVPVASGGPNDILARLAGQKLTEAWGQQVIVDNRPGAGGTIGAELAARAVPDGHTLLMVAPNHATNPTLMRKLPFDTLRDFSPVILLAMAPHVLLVHPTVPVKSVQELIALGKASPGKIAFGSGGNGTSIHLTAEIFCLKAGLKMVHVPYKGQMPAITDLIRGEVSWMFAGIAPTMPFIKAGKLRPIAVSSLQRASALPDVPPVADTMPGFEASSFYGLFVPSATPKDVIGKLNREIAKAFRSPDMRERLARDGTEVVAGSPEEFDAFFRAEIQKWAQVIKQAGIRIE